MKRILVCLLAVLMLLICCTCASADDSMQPLEPRYGRCTILNANGLYLHYDGLAVFAAHGEQTWQLEPIDDRFYLKDADGRTMLEYFGGVMKMYDDTGYTEQQWRLMGCADGSIRIVHADSGDWYLRSDQQGCLSVVHSSQADSGCVWYLESTQFTGGYPYMEVFSPERHILLRVHPEVLQVIPYPRLTEWAAQLEQAFHAMAVLTGWSPFEQIEVRGYTNCSPWGYVYREKPVIHINRQCLYEDLAKMAQRPDDWNFGALHEMSHLYDRDRWLFDGETLAHFKVAFVLKQFGCTAAPAEFPAGTTFTHATLGEGMRQLRGTLTTNQANPLDALVVKLWQVVEKIGWEPVRQAFHHFSEDPFLSDFNRFETFVELLTEYSGINVRGLFTDTEWRIIRDAMNAR